MSTNGKTTLTSSDKYLVAQLQNVLDLVGKMRSGLYTRQSKCACDGPALCSLHAGVFNRLVIVSDELARAIGDLQRE